MQRRFSTRALSIVAALMMFFSTTPTVEAAITKARAHQLTDSLRKELAVCKEAPDSVRILFDIFDLAGYNNRRAVAEELLDVSRRGASASVQLDVMRRLAVCVYSTDVDRLSSLAKEASELPETDARKSTETFIRFYQIGQAMDNMNETERHDYVYKTLNDASNISIGDPFKAAEFQYLLCCYLKTPVPSATLVKYMEQLEQTINGLPTGLDALRSMFFVQSAVIYSAADMCSEALRADSTLLVSIARLEERAAREGRRFRSYDVNRYQVYRRMLSNYKCLTPGQVEDLYAKILALTAENDDLKEDFDSTERAKIYYCMARGEYDRALRMLEVQVDNPANKKYRQQLYRDMLTAALAVGNKADMLKAAMGYNEILEKSISERNSERAREIEIRRDIDAMREAQLQAENERRDREMSQQRNLIIMASIVLVLLVGLMLFVYMWYRRAHQLSKHLADANEQLTRERDNMQHVQRELIQARDHARKADRHKTEFINNMSHEVRTPLNVIVECAHLIIDNVDENKRKYLDRYAQMMDISADMLRNVINDVLEVATLDRKGMEVRRRSVSVNSMCMIAIESVKKYVQPGVELSYVNAHDPDMSIFTDDARVEQVLINLLQNSAKFTESGSIKLQYSVNTGRQTITFAVSDTGCGIPSGKEEVIFERFEKLSNLTSGSGLGLNICRMIAELLHGTVKVDRDHQGAGSTFTFTIPMN